MQIVIVLFVGVMIVVAVFSMLNDKRRREEIAALAAKLGFGFDPHKSREMAGRFQFLNRLNEGSDRYARNILSGRLRGHDVLAFDYHYKTSDGKNTHHYNFSFFVLMLPQYFPELIIGRESLLSKIAQGLGYDDIDFESHEFSRTFCVRSPNKKFAYDICHPKMMEYLLGNRDLAMEIEHRVLALAFDKCLSPSEIEHKFGRLLEIRDLLPKYLFEQA